MNRVNTWHTALVICGRHLIDNMLHHQSSVVSEVGFVDHLQCSWHFRHYELPAMCHLKETGWCHILILFSLWVYQKCLLRVWYDHSFDNRVKSDFQQMLIILNFQSLQLKTADWACKFNQLTRSHYSAVYLTKVDMSWSYHQVKEKCSDVQSTEHIVSSGLYMMYTENHHCLLSNSVNSMKNHSVQMTQSKLMYMWAQSGWCACMIIYKYFSCVHIAQSNFILIWKQHFIGSTVYLIIRK